MPGFVATLLRSLGHTPGGSSAPAAPTALAVVNDGDGDAVTATVAVAAGVTATLYYIKAGDATWTAGNSRVGSGTIAQAGLDEDGIYHFTVIASSGGLYSLPYGDASARLSNDSATYAPSGMFANPLSLLRNTLAASATWQTLVGAGTAEEAKGSIHYYGIEAPAAWAASTAFTAGQTIRVETRHTLIYEATVAGTTGSSAPTWPTAAGGTVADGAVTWTARTAYGDPLMGAVRAARPFALVGVGNAFRLNQVAVSLVNDFGNTGQLALHIEADVPAALTDTIADAGNWFANQLGAILNEMAALAGTPGSTYLNITAIALQEFGRTFPTDRQDEGDRFNALFTVDWMGA